MESVDMVSTLAAPATAAKRVFLLNNSWLFFLCAAVLAGPAYNSYLSYDFSHSPDAISYVQMAQGNFDVCVTHRYRVVVPLLARAVNLSMEEAFGFIWPHRDDPGHHLRFAFFLVNLVFMSLVGVVLFRTCAAYSLGGPASCFAVLGFLVNRWTNYFASIPMVDSFHWLCVAMVFLAIKTGNARLLALGIFLGPLSKESFVFIVPATLLFGNLRLGVQLILYTASALLVGAIHLVIDSHFPLGGVGSVQNALDHFYLVPYSLERIRTLAGMGDIFSVLGLFNIVWLLGFIRLGCWKQEHIIDRPLWFLLASAVVQALISTSISRMLLVALPFWVVLLGEGFQLASLRFVRMSEPPLPDRQAVTSTAA